MILKRIYMKLYNFIASGKEDSFSSAGVHFLTIIAIISCLFFIVGLALYISTRIVDITGVNMPDAIQFILSFAPDGFHYLIGYVALIFGAKLTAMGLNRVHIR